MAASVRARLMNVSKASGEDFSYVLTRYGLERLLARLARSAHHEAFTVAPDCLARDEALPAAGSDKGLVLRVASSAESERQGRRGDAVRHAMAVKFTSLGSAR